MHAFGWFRPLTLVLSRRGEVWQCLGGRDLADFACQLTPHERCAGLRELRSQRNSEYMRRFHSLQNRSATSAASQQWSSSGSRTLGGCGWDLACLLWLWMALALASALALALFSSSRPLRAC